VGAAVSMNLDLHAIHGARHQVRRTFSAGLFTPEGQDDYEVTGDTTIDLAIRKDETAFRLVGRIEAMLNLSCGRCLEHFPWPVGLDIDMLYLPESENADEGDVRIEEADVNTAFYRDEQIDLGQLIREQLQLSLPMKPLCREACPGLCTFCGANRSTTPCDCTDPWEDPRLAGLKNLLPR
jgi:uncharacterized protein